MGDAEAAAGKAEAAGTPSASAAAHAASPGGAGSWRQLWQVPLLAVAALSLGVGVVTALVTKPKADIAGMLERAGEAVRHEKYDDALGYLNDTVKPYFDGGAMTKEESVEFHLLRARAVALAEQRLGVHDARNAQTVLDEYMAAQELGAALETRDVVLLAGAHVTLGRSARAMELVESLPTAETAGRTTIVKRVVERELRDAEGDTEATLRLLAGFLAGGLPPEDRAWALARQGELLLKQGLTESAIAKLLRTMPGLLASVSPEALADLHRVLGRAYFETGALAEASRQLELASASLLESDPRWAAVQSMLGRIEELTGNAAGAKRRYEAVLGRVNEDGARLSPTLGLAEVHAALGEFDESLQAYEGLTRLLEGGARAEGVTPRSVAESAMERHRSRLSAGDTERALRYAELAERAIGADAPPEVLLALAASHRQLAEEMLPEGEGVAAMQQLDPATREQARVHLVSAGSAYKRHADSLDALDNAAYGDSLWRAADSFDLAGDQEQAIPLLNDFIRFFPGDPRLAEARFRLGQAYQSRGDYSTAAEQFRALIEERDEPGARRGPGTAFADRAVVPLAQCLVLDGEAENDAEAEQLLASVASGRRGAVGGQDYRSALVELAGLRQRAGDWAAAIRYLEEAMQRGGEGAETPSLAYALAESLRRDAMEIQRTLQEAMPEEQRQELTRARRDRLTRAMELYERVRSTLEDRDERRLSKLERLQLRNAWFHLGDCAFELGELEESIRRYDAARERYPNDPASLVAMVQIVNAYVDLGELERARTAQARAKRFYEGLPAEAWADPQLPMRREDWQRWLNSMAALQPREGGPRVATPGGGGGGEP